MPVAKHQAAEAEIRKLDKDWGEAATRKQLDAVVAFYAPDAAIVWPGAAARHGTKKIRAAWAELLKTPGLSLRFTPERIDVAETGDMAADFGIVAFGHDSNAWVHVMETAKYVVVWKKLNGSWKVLYDCYNMNTEAA